ncbi:hypothetical protein LK487_18895, partial [[Eubacterium] rectale]|nr:hypothetical protein [Agathobacter rectalis]
MTTTTSTLHVLDVPTITAPTISDTSVGLTVSTAGAKITDKNNTTSQRAAEILTMVQNTANTYQGG